MTVPKRLFISVCAIKKAMVKTLRQIQISIAQLDNYGPWTVTPENKPEAYLQMLQTRLFADLEEKFSNRGGLAFLSRFDNTIIVSNGVSFGDHREIQDFIDENYPVTVSFGVGHGENAYEAQKRASEALQDAGSSQSEERKEVLMGEELSYPEESLVQIAHIDINQVTGFTDLEPIYDTHHLIQEVYLSLSEIFLNRGGLVFYTGGDNFMAPCNGLGKEEILEVLSEVEERLDIGLKAGVGQAPQAPEAAFSASEGLHDIRDGKTEDSVVFKGK